jgi:hypothetical protein
MQQGLKSQKRELILIDRRLEKLVDPALERALRKSTLQQRAELESSILATEKKLSKLPTQDELEKDTKCSYS